MTDGEMSTTLTIGGNAAGAVEATQETSAGVKGVSATVAAAGGSFKAFGAQAVAAMQETAAFDPGLYPTASAKGTRRSSPGRGRAQRLLSSTLPTTGGYVHGLVAGTVTWSGIAQVVAAKLANTATITR